jgi:hypothetical protein
MKMWKYVPGNVFESEERSLAFDDDSGGDDSTNCV